MSDSDDRLDEILQAYARDQSGAADLKDLVRQLEAGDDAARRLAARIADEMLLAGWFRAEADSAFVEETAEATRTVSDDPVFLARTLQRIERTRQTRRQSVSPGASPMALAAIAAGVLIVLGLLLASLSTPTPTALRPPVLAIPKETPSPLPPVPSAPVPPVPRPETIPPTVSPVPAPKIPEAIPSPETPRPAPSPTAPAPAPAPVVPRETIVAVATLERVEGRVTVIASEGRADGVAGVGLPGGRGLETGEKPARAVLRFPDGTMVEVGSVTRIDEIVDAAAADVGKRIRLRSGALTAEVTKQPAGRPFVVITPHGEARVVGTSLRLSVDAGSTRLEVTEGRVRLQRTDRKTVEVAAGHFAIASAGGELVSRPIEGFTLKDIPAPGLALWLRADSGVTIAAGSVAAWTDQSANRREAVQELAARRPLLIPDAARGRPAIRFDGLDDVLVTSLPIEGLGGLTLAIVAANSIDCIGGAEHGENAAIFWPESAPWGWVYLSPFQSNVKFRFGSTQPNNLPFHIRPASTGGALTLTVAVKEGTVETLYVQGAPVERATGKAASVKGTLPGLQIGSGALGKGYPGDIAEVLVYTRALSEPERQRLERALLGKYFGNR
jgi:ferric-dicitrate binding protein FerR (iron transport regulator)